MIDDPVIYWLRGLRTGSRASISRREGWGACVCVCVYVCVCVCVCDDLVIDWPGIVHTGGRESVSKVPSAWREGSIIWRVCQIERQCPMSTAGDILMCLCIAYNMQHSSCLNPGQNAGMVQADLGPDVRCTVMYASSCSLDGV